MQRNVNHVVVLGAGPAGLSAAHEATRHGAQVDVFERLPQVGGLARTIRHGRSRFDVGPHRFFTRNEEVKQLFADVVAEDLVRVARLTRIYYRNRLFHYPLKPVAALFGLGVFNSALILNSYLSARARSWVRRDSIDDFEDWVIDKFGRRLYAAFFKTYTEKVWGIPCDQIGADWAAQRIKGLSLRSALLNALARPRGNQPKTLIDEFLYPRLGAGSFYEKLADQIADRGATVHRDRRVIAVRREGSVIRSATVRHGTVNEEVSGDYFLSSAPLTELIEMIEPAPPPAVLDACRQLRYRHHVSVQIEVEGRPFPDNWIYVHSPDLQAARIANYRNFSAAMSDDASISPITVEYFAFEDDALWQQRDDAIASLASAEFARMGFANAASIVSAFVVRNRSAYPVIGLGYQDHVGTIRDWLATIDNLLPIGRCGMFKYNNQDHAMATGLLAARTALGQGRYDPWLVNIDAEYHEGGAAATFDRPVPIVPLTRKRVTT